MTEAVLSLVTLGVSDLESSISFYEAGAVALAVWPTHELARDANAGAAGTAGFGGIALAWNCRSEAEVDAVIDIARHAGAAVPKVPERTTWGGYAGYFADPDGHLWEVAYNPGFPLSDDGKLLLPD